MPTTYDSIASTVLGTATTTITFSSIPTTYTDLKIIMVVRSDRGGGASSDAVRGIINSNTGICSGAFLTLNNTTVTGGSYGAGRLFSSGGTFGSTVMPMPCATQASGIFALIEIDILNYASSTTTKSVIAHGSNDYNGSGDVIRSVHHIDTTSAITSISFDTQTASNYVAGSTVTLYGILKA
jgi:hypothetical protein